MASPRNLVRALGQHWEPIEHLVRLTRDVLSFERSLALNVLAQHHPQESVERHEEILQQMVAHDLLLPFPRGDSLELNGLVADFVRSLTHDHDLGLSEVLRARVEAIQAGSQRLAVAMASGDRDERRQAAGQLSSRFREISRQLEQDHQAILKIADEAKSDAEHRPAKRRYQQVLDAYDHYVLPMEQMMDVGIDGAFYRHLEQVEQVLDQAVLTLSAEGGLYHQQRAMRDVAFQAKALRNLGRVTLQACSDTLLPLRNSIRSYSALASDVALLLGEVRTRGANRVLGGHTLPTWQRGTPARLALGTEIRDVMAAARAYEPITVPFPNETDEADTVAVEQVDEAALLAQLHAALPVDDLLTWLQRHYRHLRDETLVRLYHQITRMSDLMIIAQPETAHLALATVRVQYHPHGVAHHG